MKNFLVTVLTMILVGCSTTIPVKRNFPEVPEEMKIKCPELKEVAEGTTKLSEVLVVVTDNYSEYHVCRGRVDDWIEWYNTQKEIFESVK